MCIFGALREDDDVNMRKYVGKILRRTLPWGLIPGVAYAAYFVWTGSNVLLIPLFLFVAWLLPARAPRCR